MIARAALAARVVARADRSSKLAIPHGIPSLSQIVEYAAAQYGVSVASIVGPRRHASATWARHVAMYMARRLTRASYPEIGAAFGRDSSTVVAACKKIERVLAREEKGEGR